MFQPVEQKYNSSVKSHLFMVQVHKKHFAMRFFNTAVTYLL